MSTDATDQPAVGVQPRGDGAGRRSEALAISNAIVHLISRRAGRGPTKARTTITSELAIVALRDLLTTAERTLLEEGHHALVVHGRAALHEGMRREAIAVVQNVTGRKVAAYLAGNDFAPNVGVVVFVFEPPNTLRAA